MQVFITVAGIIWILVGGSVLAASKGAIHEILACLLFSFGIIFLALGTAFDEWKRHRDAQKAVPTLQPAAQMPPPLQHMQQPPVRR